LGSADKGSATCLARLRVDRQGQRLSRELNVAEYDTPTVHGDEALMGIGFFKRPRFAGLLSTQFQNPSFSFRKSGTGASAARIASGLAEGASGIMNAQEF
jgi:hypothetical protein